MMKTGIGKPSRRRGVGAVEEPSAVNRALQKLVILDYMFFAGIFVAVGMGYPMKPLVNCNLRPEFGISLSMCQILAVAVFPCSRMLAKSVELHLDAERDRTHWLWKKQLGLVVVVVSILLAMVVTGLLVASFVITGVGCAGSSRLTAAALMGVILGLTMFFYLGSIVSNLLTTASNGGDSTRRVSEVGAQDGVGAGDFDDGALLSGIGVPSECLFLKNMFDPKLESQPELLFGDMCGEVEKKLLKFGKIANLYVDEDGSVYVRFEHIQSAIVAQQALHGEFNDGMRIAATFCGTEVYDVQYRRWLKRKQF